MSSLRIVIDQAKIRIDPEIAHKIKPGDEFPRALAWWQSAMPIWLTVTEDSDKRIVLDPNGYVAGGPALEVTPALRRRMVRAGLDHLHGRRWMDFSDAIVDEAALLTS